MLIFLFDFKFTKMSAVKHVGFLLLLSATTWQVATKKGKTDLHLNIFLIHPSVLSSVSPSVRQSIRPSVHTTNLFLRSFVACASEWKLVEELDPRPSLLSRKREELWGRDWLKNEWVNWGWIRYWATQGRLYIRTREDDQREAFPQ